MQNKIDNIQALRAFAALLVVALHLLAVEAKYSHDALLPEFLRIGLSGVDLFFVISGFIMVTVTGDYALQDGQHRRQSTARFLFLRITRIYPLYWVVTAMVLVIYLIHPTFLEVSRFGLSYVLNSFLLLPQHGMPLVTVGWSLIHEMYFYLVFSVLLLFPRKYLPYLLFLWLCVVIEGFQHIRYFSPNQNPFTRLAVSPITTEFIAGCYLALFFEARKNTPTFYHYTRYSIFLGLMTLMILWYFFSLEVNSIDVVGWTRVVLFTAPFVLMIYGAVGMERNNNSVAPKWAIRIGDHSYSIYLLHLLVLSVCGRIWKEFAWDGYMDNVIIIVLTVYAVLIAGKLGYVYIEKPMLRFCRRFAPG